MAGSGPLARQLQTVFVLTKSHVPTHRRYSKGLSARPDTTTRVDHEGQRMPRRLRIFAKGAPQHGYKHTARSEPVFEDEAPAASFISLLRRSYGATD